MTIAIQTRTINLQPITFSEAEEAHKNQELIYIYNPKTKNSLKGYILDFVDRDENKESVMFRPFFSKKKQKVVLTKIYIDRKN